MAATVPLLVGAFALTPDCCAPHTLLMGTKWRSRVPLPAMVATREDPDDADEEKLNQLERSLELGGRGGRRAEPPRVAARDWREAGANRSPRSSSRPTLPLVRTLTDWRDEFDVAFSEYEDRPTQQFVLGAASLLFGFFVSHGQTLGGGDQGGRWEYLSSIVAMFVVERITVEYHSRAAHRRTPSLKLLHAFKVGFLYGVVLDAIKFAG